MHKNILAPITATLLFALAPANAFAGEMWLTMDQVRVYGIEEPVSSIVVGNPAIADVTVQSNNKILLYGKAPGLTNIFFFDAKGKKLENLNIRVQSPTGNMLVLHRGVERATYSCTRLCERTITVGDSTEAFKQATTQAADKVSTAVDAAAANTGAIAP